MDQHLTLGDVIATLEQHDPSQVVLGGFGQPISYRGYYDRLAFEPVHRTTVKDMLDYARYAVGNAFPGYKGGMYTMHTDTLCYVAEYGQAGDGEELTRGRLNVILRRPEEGAGASEDVQAMLRRQFNIVKESIATLQSENVALRAKLQCEVATSNVLKRDYERSVIDRAALETLLADKPLRIEELEATLRDVLSYFPTNAALAALEPESGDKIVRTYVSGHVTQQQIEQWREVLG